MGCCEPEERRNSCISIVVTPLDVNETWRLVNLRERTERAERAERAHFIFMVKRKGKCCCGTKSYNNCNTNWEVTKHASKCYTFILASLLLKVRST